MKKLIVIILFIIVLISAIFIIRKNSDTKFDYDIVKVSEYNFFIYNENGKYGVISKEGKEIINAKYTSVIIPNPELDLFVCYNDNNVEILNSNNEKILTKYESVEPIKLKNLASALTYEKSVLKYKQDGKYGLIDYKGNEITKPIYDSIENLQPTEGKFLVSQNGKYGAIDMKGNNLVKVEYDNVSSDEFYLEQEGYKKSGFMVCNKEDDGYKYGYIDYKGNEILKTKYNEIERINTSNYKNIYLITKDNGQYGFMSKGKQILKNEYQKIEYDNNTDLLIIQRNKKYGASNLKGKIIIKMDKDEITSRGKYIYTKSSNTTTVYDVNGKEVDIAYNKSIYETENEEYLITTILNNDITYYGITDKNGNELVPENYSYIEYLYNNLFIATNTEGKVGIIDNAGKEILELKYSTLQKIKGTKIVQTIDSKTGISEFYSEGIKLIDSIKNSNVEVLDEYVLIKGEDKTLYLDYSGNKIEDSTKLENKTYPDKIGEYVKEQTTIDNIFYVKD